MNIEETLDITDYRDIPNQEKAFEQWWISEYRNNYLADKAFIKKAWFAGVNWCDRQVTISKEETDRCPLYADYRESCQALKDRNKELSI